MVRGNPLFSEVQILTVYYLQQEYNKYNKYNIKGEKLKKKTGDSQVMQT